MDFGEAGAEQIDDLALAWSAASDVGKVRRLNEDSLLVHPGLFVVADGMGGHEAGDVASRVAVDSFREHVDSLPLSPGQVERLVVEANRRVCDRSDAGDSDGMGTTLVGVALVDNGGEGALMVFNIGDSRCYAWDATTGLVLVTKDHSVVQELVDSGAITDDEAAVHPERNVVTRALGVDAVPIADFVVLPRVAHQRLLLCSDGVSGPLSESEIKGFLARDDAAEQGATSLIATVLDGPATDNASCIVIDVRWTTPPRPLGGAEADITGPRPQREPSRALIRTVPRTSAESSEASSVRLPLSEVPT